MALIQRKPTAAVEQELNTPKVQPVAYKTAIYEETNKPYKSMIAYVEGAPWTVNYYSQVVGKHSELKAIDRLASGSHQSYILIKDLELRVTSPLSDSYNEETATMKTTGTANMYSNVVPNVDDHFITESNDRSLTIFKITNVEVASTSNDTVYEVNYMVLGNVQNIPDIYSSLTSKVAKEYNFIKNRINEGSNPLVAPSEYKELMNLHQKYKEILNYHLSIFYNKSNNMMLLPGQSKKIYDYSAVEFLFKIVDPTEHNNMLSVLRAPNAPSVFSDHFNIYDVLIERNYDLLDQCNQKMTFVTPNISKTNTYLLGPFYYDIDYLVYPKNPDRSYTNKNLLPVPEAYWVLEKTSRKSSGFLLPEDDTVSIPNATVAVIHNVHNNGYYVFSGEFYNGGSEISALEILVKDYLKNQMLNISMLTKVISSYKSMTRMDQYYYGPIILMLIKEASRSMYS